MHMIANLGDIGDFVGGIGVFVTLLYLVTQVRQNTTSRRLASMQQIIGTSVSISVTSASGPVPAIFAKLERNERLTEEEFAQFLIHLGAVLTNYWQIFYQYQCGVIDKEVMDSFMARLDIVLGKPVSRAMWHKRIKRGYPADFQVYIERYLDDIA